MLKSTQTVALSVKPLIWFCFLGWHRSIQERFWTGQNPKYGLCVNSQNSFNEQRFDMEFQRRFGQGDVCVVFWLSEATLGVSTIQAQIESNSAERRCWQPSVSLSNGSGDRAPKSLLSFRHHPRKAARWGPTLMSKQKVKSFNPMSCSLNSTEKSLRSMHLQLVSWNYI